MIATILLAAALAAFPQWGEPRAVTQGPHEHLPASYFAIDSWSPDKRYLSVLPFGAVREKLQHAAGTDTLA